MAIVAALSGCASATRTTTSAEIAASATAVTTTTTHVALHLDTGSYSIAAPRATISGSVTPGAAVRVNRHAVRVHSGRWSRTLALRHGSNHVAVLATMRGRVAVRKSIEITRERSAAELEARAEAEEHKAAEEAQREAAAEAEKQEAAEHAPVCTNGTYVNAAGNTVCSPEQSPTAPAGATAECQDGTYSFSESRSGTCSHHGGVARWL